MSRSQLALARRYRPRDFQSVVGQEATLRALMSALDNQRLHHAYLFTGTRGVGKTTLARIFAKALNCEQGISAKPCDVCSACQAINAGSYADLIEVDAASRTKVEDTRELLENVQYLPTRGRFKIYLIDEVHMLSGHSFNALLKTLEEPPSHVKFLLATTDPQKMPVTVLSRCLQFHLQCLPFTQIVNHLAHVLEKEAVSFEHEALGELSRAADGSMRDALSLLDQALAYGHGRILAAEVRVLLGLTEKGRLIAVFEAMLARDAKKVLQEINAMRQSVPNFASVLTELLTLIHQIAIAQQVPEAIDDSAGVDPKVILNFAESISPEEIQLYYQIGLLGQRDLPYAPTPQMGFEMILLRMLAFQPVLIQPESITENTQQLAAIHSLPTKTESSRTEPTKLESAKLEPAKKEPIKPESPKIELSEWSALLPALNLTGMTKELASHCAVTAWSEDHIHFVLQETQKPLLSKSNEERLQKGISQYFQKPITIKISIESTSALSTSTLKNKDKDKDKDNVRGTPTPVQETPAQQYQNVQARATDHAKQLIESDPNVEQMLQRFNAKIEHISVNHLTQKNPVEMDSPQKNYVAQKTVVNDRPWEDE